MSLLKYKNYEAKIEYSPEDEGLVGELLYINDTIVFFGKNHEEVINAFHDAVDSYLDFCKERGVTPNKPFKGTFNVRIPPEQHKALSRKALQLGISLNESVNQAITYFLENTLEKTPHTQSPHSSSNHGL